VTTGGAQARTSTAGSHERIFAAVRKIPRGRVCTYGGIATLAGLPGRARLVGYALHRLPANTSVPWHRVVNAAGRIALSERSGSATTQQLRLISEGVVVSAGRISLRRFGWPGKVGGPT
jgi:methylated-DNA-protein-cysteine methyltransferase-like protein